MPQPTSSRPSRIERGSGLRPDQPKRSLATSRHVSIERLENGRFSPSSIAGSVRRRSSTGSMPSETASSSIAHSIAKTPLDSPGPRMKVGVEMSSGTTR